MYTANEPFAAFMIDSIFIRTSVCQREKSVIGIVAKVKVKAGSEAAFETAARELIACTLKEPGVLDYGLWRTERADTYAFVERYKDDAAIEAHVKSEHFRRINRQFRELLEGAPEVTKLLPL